MLRLRTLALLGFVLAGCHGGGSVDTPDAGTPVVDSGPFVTPVDDAGTTFKDPNLADGFGPFTGHYDVNGSGDLFAIQVDGHLALRVNTPDQVYFGIVDAGGKFSTEIAFPDLETCGPVTFDGKLLTDGGYTGTENYCALGAPASGPLAGAKFIEPHVYRQELTWSGAYDATETADSTNQCGLVNGTHKLTIGVARDLDGGATTVALFGDGLLQQFAYGAVDDSVGILRARAQDEAGNATDSFSLFYIADGGVSGTREADVGDAASGPCIAELKFFGKKR